MTRDINEIAAELANGLSLDDLRRRQTQGLAGRTIQQQPQSEEHRRNLEAHTARIRASFDMPQFTQPVRILKKEMEYADARHAMSVIMQARANEISKLENRAADNLFKWEFSAEQAEICRNLLAYFINDPASVYPLSKGIFIYGSPGNGKTELMRCFQILAREKAFEKSGEWTVLSKIYTMATSDKEYEPIASNVISNRFFDEFGRYSGPVLRFGTPMDINEAIIEQRYERWKRYGQFTFFIANTTPNDLQDLVTPMLLDRIRGMATTIFYPGESKRK